MVPFSTAATQIDFPPVPNGIDYLRSVVDHLHPDTGGTPRDIKYAVLHLQAAVEVLLKARLSREHWSLVFKDPGTATHSKFADSSFESCTTAAAVERLRNIARIQIREKDARALTDLTKDRNRLQHYGLTHNAKAVEARAATVLDFLLRFLDEALLPALSAKERSTVDLTMDEVREGLNEIQSYVTGRMNRLRGTELKGAESWTLRCPDCLQLAFDTHQGLCLFCTRDWDSEALADALQSYSLSSLYECPDCDAMALTDPTEFADGKVALYCTICVQRFNLNRLGNCTGCGRVWPRDDVLLGGDIICAQCQDQIRTEGHEL